jgi:hypothetical protein
MIMPAWVLRFLPLILTGVAWVATFGIGYWQGYENSETKWREKIQAEENAYLGRINELAGMVRQSEIQAQERINEIVSEQIAGEERIKNEYETVIADLRNDKYEFAGVRDCPEAAGKPVSAKPAAAADLVCYSRAELQRKIEESLAVAKECDELAERYEKLKEVYNVRNR